MLCSGEVSMRPVILKYCSHQIFQLPVPFFSPQVLIRRRPLLYVVGLLIPSIFLMMVDVTSFYLPLNSGTRIVFKVSILLGYTVFRVNITDELPSTATRTPLIGSISFRYVQGSFSEEPIFLSFPKNTDRQQRRMHFLTVALSDPSIFVQACSSRCAWPSSCSA